MKSKWITALLFGLVLIIGAKTFLFEQAGQAANIRSPSIYERVMKTRTLRCSYEVWPPAVTLDPNTGKLGGFYYDLMEQFGRDAGFKIEWVEAESAATMFEAFRAGRADMHCMAVTPTPQRSTAADFTRPIGYMPYHLYVQANDNRFNNDPFKANHEDIKMMSIDGYIGATLTKELFPKAILINLPNLSTDSDVLLSLASGKVDAAICEPIAGANYMRSNPGKVKRVTEAPLRYPSMAMALPIGETRLKAMIDTALTYYIETGFIDSLLTRHEMTEDKVLRPAAPYKAEGRLP